MLFIVIFSIVPIVPCKVHVMPTNWQWDFCLLIGRGIFIGPIMQYLGLPQGTDQYIALLVVVIVSYLLSCLIIFVYQKIKNLKRS